MSTRNSSRFYTYHHSYQRGSRYSYRYVLCQALRRQPSGNHQRFFQQAECAVENRRRSICRHCKHDRPRGKAMPQILAELDPHSTYIPAQNLEEVNSELEGSFSGIGIQFTIQNDTIHVNAVIQGRSIRESGTHGR